MCFVVFRCVFCNWPGVLRCVLWHNGHWVEVCVDDSLPVCSDRPLVVQTGHCNVLWPAVLEKACARFVFTHFFSHCVCEDYLPQSFSFPVSIVTQKGVSKLHDIFRKDLPLDSDH